MSDSQQITAMSIGPWVCLFIAAVIGVAGGVGIAYYQNQPLVDLLDKKIATLQQQLDDLRREEPK